MLRPVTILVIVLGTALGCRGVAIAQRSSSDRRSQRLLPMQRGASIDEKSQAILLQQLRTLVVSPERSQLPEFTETQLQEMEEAFARWRERSGDSQIPNLGGIPSAWINKAIEDPAIRSRAQQLLERYARDRHLGPAASKAPIRGSDATARSGGEQSEELGQPGAPLSPRPLVGPDVGPTGRETGDTRPKQLGSAGDLDGPFADGDVPPIDAAKVQSLRELFDGLMSGDWRRKAFNSPQQKRKEAQQRKEIKELTKSARANATANGDPSAQSRNSSGMTQSSGSFGGPRRQLSPFLESPEGRGRAAELPSLSDDPTTSGAELPNSMVSPKRPPGLRTPEGPSASVVQDDSLIRQTVDQLQSRLPGENRPKNRSNAGSHSTSGDSKTALDVKRDVERYGLAATLQRIFEKTVEERKQKLKSTDQAVAERGRADDSSGEIPGATAKRQHRQKTGRPQASARPSSVGNDAMMRLQYMIADVWKSIATVPSATPGAVDRARSPKLESPEVGSLVRRLSAGPWPVAIAFLATLILASLLLARKEAKRVASAAARDDVWVKDILRLGLRTRADVVRAFHHFALRRPDPIATWWTHRYVAARLSESSPNLRSVIQELTDVYEEARYLPPDVKLSAEQIERVHQALRLAEAGDA